MTNQLNVAYLDKSDLLTTLGHKASALFSNIAGYTKRRAAYRELMQLDDRMLADIGIERLDLESGNLDLFRK